MVTGIKVKRKKVPGAKNLKIRRYVQPKNAVMCLNELRPGVTYTTEQEGGVGQPFCISVEVPGAVWKTKMAMTDMLSYFIFLHFVLSNAFLFLSCFMK